MFDLQVGRYSQLIFGNVKAYKKLCQLFGPPCMTLTFKLDPESVKVNPYAR